MPRAPVPYPYVPGSRKNQTPLLLWGVVALSCLAPAAGGCQFRWGWGFLVLFSAVLLLWHAVAKTMQDKPWAPFSWVFAALAVLHVLQLIPLPPSLWTWFAPVKASFLPDQVAAGSWQPLTANVETTRDNLLVLLACLVAYNLGWAVFRRRSYSTYLGLAFLGTGFALALYGLLIMDTTAHFKFLGVPVYPYGSRVSATYTGPNQFAGLLTLILPLAGVAILLRVAEGERTRSRLLSRVGECLNTPSRTTVLLLLGLAWLTVLTALVLTQSRMGIASCLLGAILSWALVYRLHMRFSVFLGLCLAVALLVLAGLMLGLDPVLGRYSMLFESRAVSEGGLDAVELRPRIWRDSMGLVRDHWLLGGGSGSFRTLFPYYQSSSVQGWAKFAHNDYLNALTDLGVAGLVMVLTGLVLWFRTLLKDAEHRDCLRQALLFAVVWSVAAILLHSLTLFNLQEPANAWIFCLLLGVGLGLREEENARAPDRPAESTVPIWRRRVRLGLRVAVVLLMLLGAVAVLWSESLWPADRATLWHGHAKGNLPAARDQIHAARQSDPFLAQAYVAEAHALVDAAGAADDESVPDHDACLDEAERLLESALLLSPLDKDAWFEKVRVDLTRGELAAAQHDMFQTSRAAPFWPALGITRARVELLAWDEQGRSGGQIPETVLESLAAATASLETGTFQQALDLLFSVAEWEPRWERIVPRTAQAYWTYARTLASHERLKAATQAGTEALALLKGEGVTGLNALQIETLRQQIELDLGCVLIATGQYAEAQSRFRDCLGRMEKRERSEMAYSLWRRACEQGLPRGGLEFAQSLAKAFPDEAWGADLVGRSFAVLEKWPEAAEAFRRGLDLDETGERCALLAEALYRQGQLDSAMAKLDRAILLGPARAEDHLRLADWLSQKGYASRAVQEVQLVRLRWPEFRAECDRLLDLISQRRAQRPLL